MKTTKKSLFFVVAFAITTSFSQAVTVVTDFTGSPFANSASFSLDFAVAGLSGVDTLRVSATNAQSGGAVNFNNAGGNGLGIFGGASNANWNLDESFDLTVTLFNGGGGGTNVTSSFTTSILDATFRKGAGTFLIADLAGGSGSDSQFQTLSTGVGGQVDTLSSAYEVNGNTITWSRNTANGDDATVGQLQNVSFDVVAIPEPSTLSLCGLAMLALFGLRRFRRN